MDHPRRCSCAAKAGTSQLSTGCDCRLLRRTVPSHEGHTVKIRPGTVCLSYNRSLSEIFSIASQASGSIKHRLQKLHIVKNAPDRFCSGSSTERRRWGTARIKVLSYSNWRSRCLLIVNSMNRCSVGESHRNGIVIGLPVERTCEWISLYSIRVGSSEMKSQSNCPTTELSVSPKALFSWAKASHQWSTLVITSCSSTQYR
jgi:hypothetical protein